MFEYQSMEKNESLAKRSLQHRISNSYYYCLFKEPMKALSLIIIFSGGIWPMLWAQVNMPLVAQEEKVDVVEATGTLLHDHYVHPDKGKKMADYIAKRHREGRYDSTDDARQFAALITNDLQSISEDRHIRVVYNPEMVAEMTQVDSAQDTAAFLDLMDTREARNNFGFREVKILSTSVGYLRLDAFSGSRKAGATAAAAMNFLSGSEAIIIDLRQNGGGSPDMIQILSTYLFDHERVHLNSFYDRPSDQKTQRWTLPFVPGERLNHADVYILTSAHTFSAAEEFTYNLKNLKRATIIGETTGGAAHPGEMMPATAEFAIFVPTGRAINPVTGTNWEGTGVVPDIDIPADNALVEAHYLAVKKLDEKYKAEPQNPFAWTKDRLQTLARPCQLSDEELMTYAGIFGPRRITAKDGALFYQRDDGPERRLICMKKDLFMMEEIPYFRLKFIRDEGEIVAVEGVYEDGGRDRNKKSDRP